MDRLYYESYEHTPPSRSALRRGDDPPSQSPRDARDGPLTAGQARHSHRPATDRRYDPRYHYPPPPSNSASVRAPRSPVRKRRSWPPEPVAEDETISLRKEAGAHTLLRDAGKDTEVPSRGTIDQDPLIVEVPEHIQERRFVYQGPGSATSSSVLPTPPTSEDERARKVKRRPSRLTVENNGDFVPEATKRTASPYAFSNPPKLPSQTSWSERRSTPDSSQPTSKSLRFGGNPGTPSNRRDSGQPTPGRRRMNEISATGHPADESAIDDTDYDRKPLDTRSLHGNGRKVAELPLAESPRSSTHDFAAMPPASAPPIRRQNLDARRNTDTQNTLPTLGRLHVDKSRRPTPLMTSTSLAEAQDLPAAFSASLDPNSADAYSRSREASLVSRPVSREGSAASGVPTSPSRSPRISADVSREPSVLGSKPPSATNSRPASPSPRTPGDSRIPRTDLDWSALLAANASRRAKAPSRLSSAVTQDIAPDFSRRNTPQEVTTNMTPNQSASSLPYPEDSTLMGSVYMPSEVDHAYYPQRQTILAPPIPRETSGSYTGPCPNPEPPAPSLPARPALNRAFSAGIPTTTDMRSVDARPRLIATKRESFANSSQTKKEIAALAKKGLPPCPRQEPVSGKDDWYTIIGQTNIDFCPDCIDTLFERTVFRSSFRRSLPRSYHEKVRCAFGSPWIRLAWLLTLQQQRTDLTLLKDIADIEETSAPCPAGVETVMNWYGLRDLDGLFVRDFHLCYGDVRKIECLLPSLSGIFVRLPQRASYTKSVCAIRQESTRFSAYLDALVTTHEKALMARRNADPMPLIELIERKTQLRECTRDNMLIGGLWHFIPDLAPAMTVCEDCFEAVVEPEIKKNKSVAKKFNRTLQPVYTEGVGSSCQLYSPYMRKVFQRAVDENDMKYLVRKAKERREAELYLQDKFKAVMSKAKRLSLEGAVTEDDERRLNRDLEKISREWKEQWE